MAEDDAAPTRLLNPYLDVPRGSAVSGVTLAGVGVAAVGVLVVVVPVVDGSVSSGRSVSEVWIGPGQAVQEEISAQSAVGGYLWPAAPFAGPEPSPALG